MKQIFWPAFFLTITLLSCGKLPTSEPATEEFHLTETFESGNLDQFYKQLPNDTNIRFVNNPVRSGSQAVMFQLKQGQLTNNGNRSELAVYHCAKYKSDMYYGWSFMIDTTYTDTHYMLLAQWQNLPNYQQGEDWLNTFPSSPPLALVFDNGVLKLNKNSDDLFKNIITIADVKIQKGVWYDFVLHAYWTDDETGFVEAWLNDQPLILSADNKYYGSNLFTRDGNYFKFGLYRGSDKDEYPVCKMYLDEMRIGSSYAEVNPF